MQGTTISLEPEERDWLAQSGGRTRSQTEVARRALQLIARRQKHGGTIFRGIGTTHQRHSEGRGRVDCQATSARKWNGR